MLKTSRWLIPLLLMFATLNFVRYYTVSLWPYISLPKYAAGAERMPFQGRLLMMYPLRWAGNSATLQHMGVGRIGALRQPELVAVNAIGLIAMFLAAWLITRLDRKTSPSRPLLYLPWALTLLLATVNFTSHLEQNFLFPYDLPSLAFFTAGVVLIYERRFWTLFVLFPIATLNRETTLFLIPLLLLDEIATPVGLNWKKLGQAKLLAKAAALSVIWLALQMYVRHKYQANGTEFGERIGSNLYWLTKPKFWPAILSTCAFLLPLVLLYRKRIADYRLRAYLLVLWPFMLMMLVYAHLIEARCYGEVTPLVALAAVLILEGTFTLKPVSSLQSKPV